MHQEDIDRILEDFTTACRFALASGFDGIELHGAHGYLIHEFCSSYANIRNDIYGFNSEFLFASRLVAACRQEMPAGKVLSYRLSTHMIDNYYLSISSMALEHLIPLLDRGGVDVFHSSELKVGSSFDRSGRSLGRSIRAHTEKPIIGCGGVQSLADATEVMTENPYYSLVAVGRALITKDKLSQSQAGSLFNYDEHFLHCV
jgi:2,4-dienoyl-CoA reductase-like NADH-dependent reductase (Old Yellow Enzyme family)